MSKRKVGLQFREDADADLEAVYKETGTGDTAAGVPQSQQTRFGFKEKHSLDSDEEDNVEKYDMLHEDDIEGQEDCKVDVEDGIKFTPFNMQEELEEGHFDAEGMYIFKKEDQIQDNWMDNIDWVRVKEKPKRTENQDDDDDDEEDAAVVDEIPMYRQMIELMKPGESVLKALRRLGGGKKSSSSASQRWKAKRQKNTENESSSAATNEEDKENLLKLTELADRLLASGNMEIYQDTYEKLSFKVKRVDDQEKGSKPNIPENADSDDALDMFAADIDKKSGDTKEENGHDSSVQSSTDKSEDMEKEAPKEDTKSNDVKWEYKWENKEEEEVHGPFSSSEMLEWTEDDFFKDGVFVRKVGAGGHFYSSRRIDFDLYT